MLNLKRWIIEIVILSLVFAGIGYAANETKFKGVRVTDLTASRAVFTDGEKDLASTGTSAALLGALSDETGTGVAVFATSPTLVTPALGTPASGDLQNCTETTATTKGVIELATNTEVAAFTDENRAVTPEGLGYAMAGVLAYGVEWDEDESSPTLTRTGALAGIAAGSSPGNAALSIQAAMRRCILSDAGVVQYYLCATDSTDKEDCSTASVLDGTDGQVMVEIPKFAYKYIYVAATNVHSWSISSVLLPGYEWHPVLKTLRVFVSMDTTLLVRRNQMKIQSKTYPEITKSKKERIVRVPYNIQEIVVSGMDDTDERVYEYDETILSDTGRTMDEQMLLMRKIEWPEARLNIDYIIDENQSELQALENWISDGAMLRDDDGKYVGNAEKVKWEGSHLEPSRIIDGEKISEKTLAEFNKATSIAALKAVLVKVMKGSP